MIDDDKQLKLFKMFDKQINKELSEIMKRYRNEEITATNWYLSTFKNIDKVVVTNVKFHPDLSVYIDVYSDDRYFNEDDVQSFAFYLKEKLDYMGYPWIVPKLINQKPLNESELSVGLTNKIVQSIIRQIKSYGEDTKYIQLYGDESGDRILMDYRKISKELYYDDSFNDLYYQILPHPIWLVHSKQLIEKSFNELFPDDFVKTVRSAKIVLR